MKKTFQLAYGFKSHSTSINERFSKLEDCLQSRPKIQRNIFSGTTNPRGTRKPGNPLKGIRNLISQDPDNTLKGIRELVQNGTWSQW